MIVKRRAHLIDLTPSTKPSRIVDQHIDPSKVRQALRYDLIDPCLVGDISRIEGRSHARIL